MYEVKAKKEKQNLEYTREYQSGKGRFNDMEDITVSIYSLVCQVTCLKD